MTPSVGFLLSFFYYGFHGGPFNRCKTEDAHRYVTDLFGGELPPLFADSGAFSAHSFGEPITTREYADWLEATAGIFNHYANLDVKGDQRASARNLKRLRDAGFDPVPVWHAGESLRLWRKLCADNDYVAVGGVAGGPTKWGSPAMVSLLTRLFGIAEETGTGVHGFGISNWQVLRAFPWRSADASSWNSASRYGITKLFDHYRGRWVSLNTNDPGAWHKVGWLTRELGYTPNGHGPVRTKEGREPLFQLVAASWASAAAWLQQRNGRPFTLYLVDDNPSHLSWGWAGIRRWQQVQEKALA